MQELIRDLIDKKITMVSEERFNTIVRNKDKIDKLEGDIVECGVWKGGMCIFLSKLFPDRHIWAFDSYEGFQDPTIGNYHFANEGHTPSYPAYIRVSLDEVKNNFQQYGLVDEERIHFVKGWVKDTLAPYACPLKKIALLRIDVDAYSATREVLDLLYDKVVPGGFIIFDDTCLNETVNAINDFYESRKKTLVLRNPVNDGLVADIHAINVPGCYTIKCRGC